LKRKAIFVSFTAHPNKIWQTSLLSLLLLVCTISSSVASNEETPNLSHQTIIVPEKIAGVDTVSAEQLITLLTSEKPPLLIDARVRKDREYGYIETSISLPDIETNCDSLNNITKDKNQHLLFYCNGVQCGRSVVSIKVASSCGYKHLIWFKGGFAEWKEKGYQYIKNNSPILQ